VIVQKSAPLEFWVWKPGMPMDRGVWDIPVPATREAVEPDVLIAPLVGFDTAGFRLGYGGGYFDRTLAASSPRPYCIGNAIADDPSAAARYPHGCDRYRAQDRDPFTAAAAVSISCMPRR
jgi:5,10-methenyltetrahydrofolate synthetase